MCQVGDKVCIWPKSIFFLNSMFNSKKKSPKTFSVKWQTSFLEQFFVFLPLFWIWTSFWVNLQNYLQKIQKSIDMPILE
jgi:uncharacterized membrane protein